MSSLLSRIPRPRATSRILLGALLAGLAVAAAAQPPSGAPNAPAVTATYPQDWVGDWAGTGKVFGGQGQLGLRIERVLGGHFVKLTYVATPAPAEGKPPAPPFEGVAYYPRETSDGKLEGTWFDSWGGNYPLRANLQGRLWVVEWGDGAQRKGRTTYLLGDGILEVIDESVSPEGKAFEFNRVTMRQKP